MVLRGSEVSNELYASRISGTTSDSSRPSILETSMSVQERYDPQLIFDKLESELLDKSGNFKIGDHYSKYDHNEQIFFCAEPIGKQTRIKKCPSCLY